MHSPDILSLRGRALWRRLTAEAAAVALCLALVNPALSAQQQSPPTPPAPELTRAPAVEPAPPTATLRLDPMADQPPDSLALGQPFHIRVTVPADWLPGQTVSVTVTNGDQQETVVLTQIDTSGGVVTFSTPGPASIGRAVAGSRDPSSTFSIAYQGTIMGLDQLSNGGAVTISLTGFRGPQTTASVSFPVFDNPIEQNIWRIERALTVLEAITQRQQADAAWVLSQPDVPDDVRVEAQALASTAELNTIVLGQARASMAGQGTPLGTLIAGGEYLTFIVRGPGDVEWATALQNLQRRIVENADRQVIVRDNIVNYSASATFGLYELTRVLTLAGPAYEAGQLAINPALRKLGYDVGPAQSSWGRPITTEEQVFALVELVLAIGLMVGLPRLVDWLAGRTLRTSMRQQSPLPRSQQFARPPGSNPTGTQPPPRTGPGSTQVIPRTGPGQTQPLSPRTPTPPIPTTDPATVGVRAGEPATGATRQPTNPADPFAPPPEAASSPTLRGGEPTGVGNKSAATPEAASSPTLRGGQATAVGNNRAATPGGRAPAGTPRVSAREAAMNEVQQLIGRARQAGVSDEVIDLIWQNSPTVRQAATRLRGATTLANNNVSNGVIADALRVSRTQAEVDELFSVIFEAGPQHGVLNPTLRDVFANAGNRDQVIFGIRRQIGLAAADELRVEVVRSRTVKETLVEAEKLAKQAGMDLSTIPGGITPEARLDRIVRGLLVRRGYDLDVEVGSEEVIRIQEISARTFAKDPQRPDSGGRPMTDKDRMTDEDVVWLTDRLAEDPFYFNNLPTRGRYSNGEFIPILDVRSAVRLRGAYRDATGGDSFGNYDPIGSLDSLRPPAGGRPVEGQPGSATGGSSAPPAGAPPTPPRQAADWRALIEAAPTNVGPSPATTPTVTPVPLPGSPSTSAGGSTTDSGNVWVTRGERYIAQLEADRNRLREEIEEYEGDEKNRRQRELREVEDSLRRARSMQAMTLWLQEQDKKKQAALSAPATGGGGAAPNPAPDTATPGGTPNPTAGPTGAPNATTAPPPATPPSAAPPGPSPAPVTPGAPTSDAKNISYETPTYAGYGWDTSDKQTLTLRLGARFGAENDKRGARFEAEIGTGGAAVIALGGGLMSPEDGERVLRDNPGVRKALQNFSDALQAAAINAAEPDDVPQDQATLTWTDDQPIVVASNDTQAPSLPWAQGGLWVMLREALGLTRAAGPYASRGLRPPERWIAPSHRAQQSAGAPLGAGRPSVKLFFTSLGRSSGESVRMTVVNDGNVPVRIALGAVALEPLEKLTERDVQRELKKLGGKNQVTVNVEAYCLNLRKPPPAAGMVMRLADPSRQAKVAPLARIGAATRRLYERGTLNREADSKRYVQNLLQWVIWTQEQKFDEQGFRRAFVEHAQKNIAGAGRKWTRELEQAVTAMTPHRWTDIQAILREAGTPQR